MIDFLLPTGVDVRASKQKISLRRLTDYVKEKCFDICSAIVFLASLICGTVEPRLSGPRLSGLFDYPDFFSGPVFFMNINKL